MLLVTIPSNPRSKRTRELLVPKEPSLQPELRPSEVTIYKVRKGDSLWSIASRNKITVEQLLEKNNIDKNAALTIGQENIIDNLKVVGSPEAVRQRNSRDDCLTYFNTWLGTFSKLRGCQNQFRRYWSRLSPL